MHAGGRFMCLNKAQERELVLCECAAAATVALSWCCVYGAADMLGPRLQQACTQHAAQYSA
jgi:hypothetical protein